MINVGLILRNALKLKDDKSFTSYSFFSAITFLSSPINAFLIVYYLDLTEQGLYYTIFSFLSIASYAEFGLGRVLTQLVSKAYANSLKGDIFLLKEYFFFTLKCAFWLFTFVASTSVVLLFSFVGADVKEYFAILFVILSISSGINVAISVLNGFLDGCDENVLTNKRRTIATLFRLFNVSLFLFLGCNLMSYGYGSILTSFISIIILMSFHKTTLLKLTAEMRIFDFFYHKLSDKLKKKAFPLQIKYMQSWLSGIFINALIIPIIYHFEGAETAGKFGFSLAIINMVYLVASMFINSQIPIFAQLNSKGKYDILRKNYNKNNQISIALYLLGAVVCLLMISLDATYFQKISDRVLELLPILVFFLAYFFRFLIENKAAFIRSFRVEPLTKIAWLQATICAITIPLLTYSFGVLGTTIAILLGYSISYPFVHRIFRKYYSK